MGITVTHDVRGAPVATRADGTEDENLLLSLTDEDEVTLCGWAQKDAVSSLVGVGIDLVSPAEFEGARGEYLRGLLFTDRDRAVISALWPERPHEGFAFAFGAKEAAFKALAAPLRRWYESHDEELVFDLRGFELMDATHVAATARKGEAARAMGAMGVTRIELDWHMRDNYLVTCALAFK